MNETEILALVKDALAEVAPNRAAEFDAIDLNTKIRDLGIDSVAAMEMVGFVEERLEVTFPDEDLAQLNTFNDLANLIRTGA
jgi:acyl carrier protein